MLDTHSVLTPAVVAVSTASCISGCKGSGTKQKAISIALKHRKHGKSGGNAMNISSLARKVRM